MREQKMPKSIRNHVSHADLKSRHRKNLQNSEYITKKQMYGGRNCSIPRGGILECQSPITALMFAMLLTTAYAAQSSQNISNRTSSTTKFNKQIKNINAKPSNQPQLTQSSHSNSTTGHTCIKEALIVEDTPITKSSAPITTSPYTLTYSQNPNCEGIQDTVIIDKLNIKDCRSLTTKAFDKLALIQNELSFHISHIPSKIQDSLLGNPEYVIPSGLDNVWKVNSQGLYVLVHGLKGHPSQWDNQAARLKQLHPEADIRQVRVPEQGNCKLELASDPIVDMIRDYIKQNPNKPVSLFGVSNGGRIILDTEIQLRDTTTPVRVSSVAGVLFGSGIMDQLVDHIPVLRDTYDSNLRQEISYGSDKAKEILNRQRQKLDPQVVREYEMWTSSEDTHVWPYSSALANIEGASHHIVRGEGHASILDRVCKEQVSNAIAWMKQQNQ